MILQQKMERQFERSELRTWDGAIGFEFHAILMALHNLAFGRSHASFHGNLSQQSNMQGCLANVSKRLCGFAGDTEVLQLARSFGSASTQHPLQVLTDEYLNKQCADTGPSWSPSDPPPDHAFIPQGTRSIVHGDPLAAWICAEGGYINSHLSIGASPTLGCRGVLIGAGMAELAENEAVIMLPEHVTISLGAAREGLSTVLSRKSVEAAQANPLMLLALHLAAEKRRGKASFWATYIKSLPKQAPSGWAMRKDMQASRAKELRLGGSKGGLRHASKLKLEAIWKASRAFGTALKVSEAELLWAYSMVESRCYTCRVSAEEVATHEPVLLPYIDMCNHSDQGSDAAWGSTADGRRVACLVQSSQAPILGGELFTNYFTRERDMQQRFLEYGFV